jgi:hypothetical protein
MDSNVDADSPRYHGRQVAMHLLSVHHHREDGAEGGGVRRGAELILFSNLRL